jgi:hypothetical protein
MATKLFTVGDSGKQVGSHCLWTMPTKLFTLGQKQPKGVAGFRYKGTMDIFWTAW